MYEGAIEICGVCNKLFYRVMQIITACTYYTRQSILPGDKQR